jgi:uncharacterized protein
MLKSISFLLLSLVIFSGTALAAVPTDLFPQQQGLITDQANILDQTARTEIKQAVLPLYEKGQAEIAIVTINSLNDYPIEDYTLDLGRFWGVGNKELNNGIVLLIAPNDKQARIEVGYGVEGYLTDAESSWIIQDTLPFFRENQFSEGTVFAVKNIISSLEVEYLPQRTTTNTTDILQSVFPFIIFGFIWLAGILGRSKSWYTGGIIGAISSTLVILFTSIAIVSILSGFIIFASTISGLIFDKIVSSKYHSSKKTPWWAGGGNNNNGGGFGGSGSSGGFGGFSGGSFGGGGSSGRW